MASGKVRSGNFRESEVSQRYTFQLAYDRIPTIVLSAETSTDSQGMVNVFITSLDTKTVQWETSAPFTGIIHVQVFVVGDD